MFFSIAVGALALQATSVMAQNMTLNSRAGPNPQAKPAPADPNAITAHPDGNCQKPLAANAVSSLPVKAQFPDSTTIHQPVFPGAESTDGGGGYDVWWRFPDPATGCRTILMKPYSQDRGTPGLPSGKEIINIGRGGCYFGPVPPATDLMTSTCCGAACVNASLNSTSLVAAPSKRSARMADLSNSTNDESRAEPKAARAPAAAHAFSGSPAANARRYYFPLPTEASCNFAAGQPYSQAGQQVIVTSTQYCAEQPCTIAVQNTVSFSTTATSSKSQTITNSLGYSLALTGGFDFIADATITDTFSYEFSIAIQKTTGLDIMRGNTTAITNTLPVKTGTSGAVTFTPVYKCYTGTFDCGKGQSDPIDVCQPDLSGQGGALKGEYDIVTYNG